MDRLITAYKIWHNILPRIPKPIKYSLGEKISNLFIEAIELIIIASYSGKDQKSATLYKAGIKLDLLKYFFQIAFDLDGIKSSELSKLSVLLVEVGKMLGGWQRYNLK